MSSNKFQSNFNKVMEFNRAFDMVSQEPAIYSCFIIDSNGNVKYDPFKNIRFEIFKDSPLIINLRLALIKEEIGELTDAIIQKDIIEQRDACADILYVVYGMADVLGISINDVFNDKIEKTSYINYYINNILPSDFNKKIQINDTNSNSNEVSIYYSNFNKIKFVKNEIIGVEMSSKSTYEIVNYINYNLLLVYLELENNCNLENSNETIVNKFEIIADNLYNLLKWTYTMTCVLGVNADNDFAIVHNSNMSKLCDNEDDAKATIEDYKIKYIAGVSPYDSPYYYYLPALNKWIIKNLSTGKALKNIKYKKVSFANPRFVF